MFDRPARPKSLACWAVSIGLVSLTVSPGLSPAAGSELRQTPVVKAVQRARSSVVNIRGEKTVALDGPQLGAEESGRRVNGMGTGVVIDPRGYIVTNHHVVDGVKQILVTLADGQEMTARLIIRDPETDLAIIKIDAATKLPVIPIGTSSDLLPGETVLAVGNAYGYGHTVTQGIISALHRAVQVSDAQFYDDLIQTDASINPGNSGGPLLNIDGEMIGINVAVRAGANSIGFAIPVDKAIDVVASLLASCGAEDVWHGVVLSEDCSVHGKGAVVASVDEDSPAAESGLRSGDVISAVEDVSTECALDFHRAMLQRRPGEQVRLAARRSGEPLTFELSLAKAPRSVTPAADPSWEVLGLQLKPIPPKQFRQRYRTHYRGGLTVTAVRPNGAAANRGIRPGDVLVGMDVWETVKLADVAYVLNRPDFNRLEHVRFEILRRGSTFYGFLPVTAKTARRP